MTSKAETKLCKKMKDEAVAAYGERLVLVKNHGTEFSRAGVSDFTGCLDGVYFAVEVKAPESYGGSVERALTKGPTVLQRAFVGHVLEAAGCAGFAATVEQFMEVLAHAADREGEPRLMDSYRCTGHNIIEA